MMGAIFVAVPERLHLHLHRTCTTPMPLTGANRTEMNMSRRLLALFAQWAEQRMAYAEPFSVHRAPKWDPHYDDSGCVLKCLSST
jgi:hypothetical protein